MQLLEHLFQLFGDRQSEVGGILQDTQAVIRNRPEDDSSTQDTGLVQDVHVQHLGDAHQQEGQHLPAEAAEANRGAELMVLDGAHDAGEVVRDHKDQQRVEQAVASAQEEKWNDGVLRTISINHESFNTSAQVSGPTTPSGSSAWSHWNLRTAVSRASPNRPSRGPV